MHIFHDSRDPVYRSPGGAAVCGTQVRLAIRVSGKKPQRVVLRQWNGGEHFLFMWPSAQEPTLYEATVALPDEPTLLWYDFHIWIDGQFYWYGNAEDQLGGEGALLYGEARSFQITVYDPAFTVPAWTRGAVFYQIFPDRFARGSAGSQLPMHPERLYHEDWTETPAIMYDPETGDNVAHDFFGGTLRGIRENLPYIASLGITALYLNPIFHARTNHRFDTIDWKAIDPTLGTEADFHALCEAAEALGIRIVLDGVFSHAGSSNPFFLDARAHKDSPYKDWFHFDRWPDKYKSWWGFTTLPELNKAETSVQRYFLTDEDAVVKHWLREGADGWRIDVADELPMAYLRAMRQSVRAAREDAILIGEVWEDASNKISYGEMRCYCLGDTLDGVMNYPLREAALSFATGGLDAGTFKRRMDSLYENYPPPFAAALLNLLGSHDRARTLNVLGGAVGEALPREARGAVKLTAPQRALAIRRLRLLLELLVAMPGMPCVYYGDEAGMEGSTDPFNRGAFPWGREDTALTDFFRQTLARRRTVAALSDGALEIEAPHPDVLCVARKSADQVAVTVINRSGKAMEVTVQGRPVALDAYGSAWWTDADA